MTKAVSQRHFPVTPDGRYFVVRGRLWRTTNPNLDEATRSRLVADLMQARRDVGSARRKGDRRGEKAARAVVNEAKTALGERGPVWWEAGGDDHNRRMAVNTPYAEWYASLEVLDDNPCPARRSPTH